MSSSRALCSLPICIFFLRLEILSYYCYHLFFFQCIIKQLLVSVFVCGIHNNQGYQPLASADNPYLDLKLDYSGYHKNLIQ